MRVRVNLGAGTAIMLGREPEYDLTLNLADYSPEQRARLARAVDYNGRLTDTDLLDERGDITPASVQAVIEKEAAKKATRRAEETELAKKAIAAAETDGDIWEIERTIDWELVADAGLKKQYDAAKSAWKARQDERKRAEREAREEQERKEAERKRAEAAAAEQIRREAYCRAVSRLGTALQKRKWAAGLMSPTEIENMVLTEYFKPVAAAGYKILPHEKHLKYSELWSVDCMTDEMFERYEQLRTLLPSAKISLTREIGVDDENDDKQVLTCAEIEALVDGVQVRADVVL